MLPYFILDTIQLGPLTIYVWGLFAGLAFAAALYLALKEAKRKGISENAILDLAILVLVAGVAGARLAYAVENWDYFSQNFGRIARIDSGGLMFYGGLAGALAAAAIYIKLKKMPFWKTADTVAPSLALGEFIGRIGCSLADLHIGSITALPWGQEYVDGSVRHPVGIYMALNGLAIFAALWLLKTRIKVNGALFLIFLLWYSGIRFLMDFLRCADLAVCDPRYYGFTPSQHISAVLFLTALALIILMFRSSSDYIADLSNKIKRKAKFMQEEKNQDFSPENQSATADSGSDDQAGEKNNLMLQAGASEAGMNSEKDETAPGASGLSKKRSVIAGIFVFGLLVGAALAFVYYSKIFKSPIFSYNGKTWVSYSDPIVNLTVVNDKNCENCDIGDMVKQMKTNAIPTMAVVETDFDSAEGKALIAKFGIKSLPALVFDSSVEKAEIFPRITPVLIKKDNDYYINPASSGVPQGRLLEAPRPSEQDRVKGPADAPVTILEFSDFQCPYCKMAAGIVEEVLAAYPDKVKFIYRHFPLAEIHKNAQYAAEASECAGDQGKFWEMSEIIFANQDKLAESDINKYAKELKLNMGEFGDCLHDGKFKAKIEADIKSGTDYGISGTPSFFVGDRFVSGGAALEDFKAVIDEELRNK